MHSEIKKEEEEKKRTPPDSNFESCKNRRKRFAQTQPEPPLPSGFLGYFRRGTFQGHATLLILPAHYFYYGMGNFPLHPNVDFEDLQTVFEVGMVAGPYVRLSQAK